MTQTDPAGPPSLHRRLAAAATLAALVLALVASEAATVRAAQPARSAGDVRARATAPGSAPSAMYEDAMSHQGDRISFVPGDRVTVPFQPRAGDGWAVAGRAPGALPAGRLSGREMAGLEDAAGGEPGASGSPAPDPAGLPPADVPADDVAAIAAEQASLVAGPAVETADAPGATGLRREVYGFLPYWEVGDASTRLNFDVLSHVAFFSVGADAAGNLVKRDPDGTLTTGWGGWTSQRLTDVINAAHAKRTRVTLTVSVFGWTSGSLAKQKKLLGSAAARLNLAKQAVAAVRDRGADGVNLDFEPLASGCEDEFVALVRSIRTEFNKIRSGYSVTFDTFGMPGNYPLEAALAPGGADAILVMGYDYRTAGATYAGSIDPLSGPAYDLSDTVDRYLARVPASKVILGIPYYGRAWSTVSAAVNARTQTGLKYGYSSSVTYENAVALAGDYGRRWDGREQSAWVAYQRQNCTATYGCATTWRQVYYDDATSLRLRYDLVNRSGLRGAGIWALGYDGTRPELYRALADKFLHDTTPPLAGIRIMPASAGDEGFTVRWRATDDWSGVASYDVQVSIDGGAWQPWRSATTATSDVWLGTDGTGYAFRVRARDGKGNLSPWNVTSVYEASPSLRVGGFARVVVDSVNVRGNPDTSASRVATLSAGDVVALVDGPISADGYTWYEVVGPLAEWQPVGSVRRDVWVAAGGNGTTLLAATRAPNATLVTAGIRRLSFGDGGTASLGPSGAAARAFSPNGDGTRDRLTLRWSNRRALDSLTLRVLATDGKLLGTTTLPDLPAGAQSYGWDGRGAAGVLPDGTYLLQLVGKVGTTTYSAPSATPAKADQVARYAVTVDTVAPTLKSAAISGTRFSPDGDGRLDTITVSGSATGGAVTWTLAAAPVSGSTAAEAVRTMRGTGASASATWNGTVDGGAAAPDGTYRLTLALADAAGNAARKSWDVVLDRRHPVVAVAAAPAAFSANGDGASDSTKLSWTSDEPVAGTLSVYHGTTRITRWAFGTRSSAAVIWTGRDSAGRLVADGRYTVRAELTDRAGNRTTKTATVTVDRTAGFLRWTASVFFPQDRDTLARTSTVSFRLARTAATKLQLFDAAGRLVRTAWSSRTYAAGTRTWTWDGKVTGGAYAPRGRYTAVLTATSSLGTTILRRAVIADAFAVIPSATTLGAGQTLVLAIRSAEPLGGAPWVTLTRAGRPTVAATVTRLADGSWRATVKVAAGAPGPAVVTVTARDTRGGTNTTKLGITIR